MGSSRDPRTNRKTVGMDSAPARCQMESSFLSILQSSGLAEWAARAEQQAVVDSWHTSERSNSYDRPSSSSASDNKSSHGSSSRSSQKPEKRDGRSSKSKHHGKDSHSGRSLSKRKDVKVEEEEDEIEEQEATNYSAQPFVPSYSGYNTMDVELNIIRQHLAQHQRH